MFPAYEKNCIIQDIHECNNKNFEFYLKHKKKSRKLDEKIIYLLHEIYKFNKENNIINEIDGLFFEDIEDFIKNESKQDDHEIIKIKELVYEVENLFKIKSLIGEKYKWFEQCFIDLVYFKINVVRKENTTMVRINNFSFEYSEISNIVNKYLIIFVENFFNVYKNLFVKSDVKMQPFTHFLLYIFSYKDLVYINGIINSADFNDYLNSILISKMPNNLKSLSHVILKESTILIYYNFTNFFSEFQYTKFMEFFTINIQNNFHCLDCKIPYSLPFFLIIEAIEDINNLIIDIPHQDELRCETNLNVYFKYKYSEFLKIIGILNFNTILDIRDKRLLKFVLAYMITKKQLNEYFINLIKKFDVVRIIQELKEETSVEYFSKYKDGVEKIEKIINYLEECSVCFSIHNIKVIDNIMICLECRALSNSCKNCSNLVTDLTGSNKQLQLIKTCPVCLLEIKSNFCYNLKP